MNRLLRAIFLTLAGLLVVFAALFAWHQHVIQESALTNTVWAALVAVLFFVIAAWRFPFETKAKIFILLLGLFLIEVFLQVAALLGVLPAVNTKLKAPYARVYWTGEGRGNSIRNRYGWHFPEFNLAAPKKITIIGDSIVEAVEVGRTKNEAAVLQGLLRAQSKDWSVLGLGSHGTGPAQHLSVMDYAIRHFAPQEAIVVLYLGNDVSDCSPALALNPMGNYIYYDLDAAGQLTLSPDNTAHRDALVRSLESCHLPLWVELPVILKSHCLMLQTALSIRDHLRRSRQKHQPATSTSQIFQMTGLGLNPKPFAIDPEPDVRHAMDVMFAELTAIQQQCETNHIQLRLVTVPFFPAQFYATQTGTNWSTRFGEYDFLARDREIAAFAGAHTIPFLSFGDWLAAKKTEVQQIRKLYFFNGSGHFTEPGHQMCAQAMYETFYSQPQP